MSLSLYSLYKEEASRPVSSFYQSLDSNKTIVLLKNTDLTNSYILFQSRSFPDVNISIYDTFNEPLSMTYSSSKYCYNDFCYNSGYLYFDKITENTTSLTFSADGSNSQYSLFNSVNIAVLHLQSGNDHLGL